MAIDVDSQILATALWPQGDIRDPLGIWGSRLIVVGDASGGQIRVGVVAAAERNAQYVYTIYSVNISKLTGTSTTAACRLRILTSWPDISPGVAGVQAYASNLNAAQQGNFTISPTNALDRPLVQPQDRFLLCFDPRPSAGVLTIAELRINDNVLTDTYAFEAYGYYWDRSVLGAPGGPRHPGAN